MSAAGVVAEPERRSDVCEPTLLHLPGIEPPSSQHQHRPWPFGPYKMRVRTCEVCGVLYRPTYGDQRTCSRQCGVFLRWMAAGKPLSMPRLHGQHTDLVACCDCGRPMQPGRKYCTVCSVSRSRAGRWERGVKVCTECGDHLGEIYRGMGNLCAPCREARDRERKRVYRIEVGASHRARCRFYGVPYDRSLKRGRVFRRDRYRCHICGKKTLPATHSSHPRHPTIDCIVPLSVEGSPGYVYENVACACFQCNSVKGAGVGGEGDQLRLMG